MKPSAVNIYSGQLRMARLTAPSLVPELREFLGHEERHREIFGAELRQRGMRRCRSYLLCGAGGYCLGLATGLFGRGAIAATTVAVERVVLSHLRKQLEVLEGRDAAASAAVRAIVNEEQEHHDRSKTHATASPFWLTMLAPLVALATEVVIWAGMRM